MRKAPSALLLSVLVPLAGVVPVVSLPQAAPRPVTPEVRSQPLSGVDLSAVGRTSVRRSLLSSTQARSATPATEKGRAAGRPEVLVSRTGLDSFDLLGVTWQPSRQSTPAPRLTVIVRTHDDGGWTGWMPLDIAPTPRAAEAKTARPGTEPLWVGASDGYQVRVDVRAGTLPRGLRVDLIDPGSSPADAHPGSGRAMQSAAAAAGAPAIFTRADWGADERLRGTAPRYNTTVKAGFVHHTAGTNNYSEAEVPKILRAIYAYHVKGNGWSDVGYNFLVDRFGRLWEGRYGGMDRAVVGAHTGGFNVDTFAVSAIGNYDKAPATPEMVDAIARVMAWKLAMSFRDPAGTALLTSEGGGTSRYPAGQKVTFNNVAAHRDAGATSCPGSNLYAQLGTIRALTTSYLGTTMFDPRPSSAVAAYGTGASITTTARVNTDQSWRLEVRELCGGALVRTLTGTASPAVGVAAGWDLRDEAGSEVRPGAYDLSLVGADSSASTHTWRGTVSVNPVRTKPPTVGAAASPGRTGFVPVDPIRLYDTRADGNFPVGPGQRLDLRVPGVGKVPAEGIGAVALNVSATCASAATTVSVWPAGTAKPASVALNVPAGIGASALAVTALGGDGVVSLVNSAGTTELAVHVVGYYPVVGGQVFRPTKTLRLYDSRLDPAGPLAAGAERTVAMPNLSGIPATAMTGALLNVTAQGGQGTGSLTVQSLESARESATVRFAPGATVKNRAVARLENGTFKISARDAATHVVVDVVGWWAPAEVTGGRLFQSKAATRVLDTTKGIGVARGSLGAGRVISVQVAGKGRPVPGSARAVVINLTAIYATRPTFVTAWPNGSRRPAFPDLSVPAYRPTANLVVLRIGAKNRVRITNGSGSTHLVGDVVGYYP
ncbi:MAG: peptidoglycan recognition protein [Spirochaetaceae bacterium]|nr:peptidoglycan recognition protein [Spirochaetaceae bacterium]